MAIENVPGQAATVSESPESLPQMAALRAAEQGDAAAEARHEFAHRLDFLARYIRDDWERLEALSFALENQLCPQDPDNPQEGENVIAWRLAEMLNERLTDRTFLDYVDSVLLPPSNHVRAAA